ncbi:hypothetical protein LTR36_008324 [Oleoguttula mirabilis]|uniref:Uncharacterized protein n=1 Tax=Oleoguttula mirabilis TaxID=1507867 RepID=A0AAV9J9M6_9PEZI|nr:hypothetical protein LTR36_008324 [Oleoguttula mirabilis]
MTATEGEDASEYQHWPDDDDHSSHLAVAARGYSSQNGLQYHTYQPSQLKPVSPVTPKAPQPVFYQYQQQPQMMAYPVQYPYAQVPYAYPAPAYYGYPHPAMPHPAMAQPQPQPMADAYVYQPAPVEKEKPEKPAKAKPNTWKGRTKAEVEEDNMKIASKEGAYDKRKVVPQVKDDQMMWVVETDGSHTLRTIVNIKDLKGEWKKDPRYEDSYYFVREEEEKKD